MYFVQIIIITLVVVPYNYFICYYIPYINANGINIRKALLEECKLCIYIGVSSQVQNQTKDILKSHTTLLAIK